MLSKKPGTLNPERKAMKDLEKPRAEEITRLHNELVGHLRQSLDKAIRIGELLTEQKATLKHGQWGGWINDNLPFTDRTTRNYMRLYRKRDQLKTENVSDLKQAYLVIAKPLQLEQLPDEPATELTATQWEELIESLNQDIEDERCHIKPYKGKLADSMFGEWNDGSMTDEEIKQWLCLMEVNMFACFWQGAAHHRGLDEVPEGIQQALIDFQLDAEIWKPMCKEGCQQDWESRVSTH